MLAVIQAGGRGTRLTPLTKDEIPKSLYEINGIPIIKRQIDVLMSQGIDEIIVITGHLGEVIEQYLKEEYSSDITFVREKTPLGSGGSLTLARHLLGNDDFLFVNGDLVFDICVERMVAYHQKKKADITLFAHPNTHPYDSDLLKLDKEGRVSGIERKGIERNQWFRNMVNAGIAIVNSLVLEDIPDGQVLNFEHDIVEMCIRKGDQVFGYCSPEYVHDAGTPERVRQIEKDLVHGIVELKNLGRLQKAIFLDRDGTINRDNGLIYSAEQLELMEHVPEAIKEINDSAFLALCVTNQSVIARGLCDEKEVERIHCKMETLLGKQGAYLNDIAYCPHHPHGGYSEERPEYKILCECRKPGIQLVTDLAEKYHVDLSQSWMIGDSESDMICGKHAGMFVCLIGYEACETEVDMWAEDLLGAVRKILNLCTFLHELLTLN